MLNHPPVEKPLALLDVGAGVSQNALSNSSKFGYLGKVFVAEVGTMAAYDHASASNGTVAGIESIIGRTIGQNVKVLDPHTGKVGDFLTLNTADGSFRPDAIKFDHADSAIYVTSIGVIQERTITPNGAALPLETTWMYPNTGVIWKITHVQR